MPPKPRKAASKKSSSAIAAAAAAEAKARASKKGKKDKSTFNQVTHCSQVMSFFLTTENMSMLMLLLA